MGRDTHFINNFDFKDSSDREKNLARRDIKIEYGIFEQFSPNDKKNTNMDSIFFLNFENLRNESIQAFFNIRILWWNMSNIYFVRKQFWVHCFYFEPNTENKQISNFLPPLVEWDWDRTSHQYC